MATIKNDFDRTYSRDGNSSSTITFVEDSTSADTFINGLLGGYVVIAGFLIYIAPGAHPIMPGVFANSGGIVAPTNPDASKVDIEISYGIIKNTQEPLLNNRRAEISLGFSGEVRALPKKNFTWAEGAKSGEKLGDDDITPFLITPQMELSIRVQEQVLQFGLYQALFAKVNSTTFFGLGPKTVLYHGPQTGSTESTDGVIMWDADHTFTIRTQGFNKDWDGQQFSRYTPEQYETANLNLLF